MSDYDVLAELNSLYDANHRAHEELARLRQAHGAGYLDYPHYMMLNTATTALSAAISALDLLRVASAAAAICLLTLSSIDV